MKLPSIIIACSLLTTSCASIVSGSSQDIAVSTSPNIKASCKLSNDKGSWDLSETPATAKIERSYEDLEVKCSNKEKSGQITNKAETEAWVFGNVLFGGLIGILVDGVTGSASSYDDEIVVPVEDKK